MFVIVSLESLEVSIAGLWVPDAPVQGRSQHHGHLAKPSMLVSKKGQGLQLETRIT